MVLYEVLRSILDMSVTMEPIIGVKDHNVCPTTESVRGVGGSIFGHCQRRCLNLFYTTLNLYPTARITWGDELGRRLRTP